MVLAPGNYVVVEVLQAGWHQSYPSAPVLASGLDTGQERLGCFGYANTVVAGQATVIENFGNFIPTKAGTKFNDLDGDGTWDASEPGLPGWEIRAYTDDGDGRLEQAEYDAGPAGTTMTDCRGEWGLVLAPGSYVVVEVLQPGWQQTYPDSPVLDAGLNTGAEQLGPRGYANTVVAGQPTITGEDFGNGLTPPISGYVWHDLDADAIWDPGEPPLADWNVYVGNDPGPIKTDANGFYSSGGLPAGAYVVREELPVPWEQSYPGPPEFVHVVTVPPGAQGRSGHTESPNFGNWLPAEIHGFKWNDLDGDGDWETNESGLNGWSVYLDLNFNGRPDVGEPATVTARAGSSDGAYAFTGLRPGAYLVRELVPGDWQQTFPIGTSLGHLVTVQSGQVVQGTFGATAPPNFGESNEPPTQVIVLGVKFEDMDGDGRDINEPGLSGWEIRAYLDENHNNLLDQDEFQSGPAETDTTDANGAYQFTLDAADNYIIVEVLQNGWRQSGPAAGVLASGLDTGGVALGPDGYAEFFTAGMAGGRDFGNYRPAEIRGFKWEDVNADGQWSAAEGPLGGWTIYLDLNDSRTFDANEPSTITGSDGAYTLGDLRPGTYYVREVLQSGWAQSYPGPSQFVHRVTVQSGQVLQGRSSEAEAPNFGNFRPDVMGYKWYDANNNGAWDPDEPGLNGWTIHLDINHDGIADQTFVTQNDGTHDGAYWFLSGTPTGTDVTIWENIQPQWTSTFPADHSGKHSQVSTPTLGGWQQTVEPNFGNWQAPGQIQGYKWEDLDADGAWDAGEPPLANWNIYIGNDPNPIKTDSNGFYSSGDLPPGTYVVREEIPTPWQQSYPGRAEFVHVVVVESGQAVAGGSGQAEPPNFGNWHPAEIRGFKWNDLDGDGAWDANEAGLNGWTIYLDLNNSGAPDVGEPAAITANDGVNDGAYAFEDVKPGPYTLREVAPGGQTYPGGASQAHIVSMQSNEVVQGRFGHAEEPNFGNRPPSPVEPMVVQFITPMSVYRAAGPFVRPPDFQIAIGGYVWHDQGNPGVWDATEPGLNGVVVYVDLDGSGTRDPGEPAFSTVTGQRDGAFWFSVDQFAGAVPGTFTLRIELPTGMAPSFPGAPGFSHVVTIDPDNGLRVIGDFGAAEAPNFGVAQDFVNSPPPGRATIKGYKWHDIDQDGQWDANEAGRPGWRIYVDQNGNGRFDSEEPSAVTGEDGGYVFANLAPGTYTLRDDLISLSDGTYTVQKFPAPDASGKAGHTVTVVAGQVLDGGAHQTREPNFGRFEYSPFVRPADDYFGHIDRNGDSIADAAEVGAQFDLLAALEPWQSFSIPNQTDADFNITEITKSIQAPGNSLVTVYRVLADGSLAEALPVASQPGTWISVPKGSTARFFAFYDPAIRDGNTVTAQYPDWFSDQATPPHQFQPEDHLEILTDTAAEFRVGLVGGSTLDSDIFYDGAVDGLDLGRLDDLLQLEWPIQSGVSTRFDPTSDINARLPNGAETTLDAQDWPVFGTPRREIGLGDYGTLNEEWDRARAPFLDLDPDNSSGVLGVGYTTTYVAGAAGVTIADRDARFANSVERILESLTVAVENPLDGSAEQLTSDLDLPHELIYYPPTSEDIDGRLVLVISSVDDVGTWNTALQHVFYQNTSAIPDTSAARIVTFTATGASADFVWSATHPVIDQTTGNTATARIAIQAAAPVTASLKSAVGLAAMTDGLHAAADSDDENEDPWQVPIRSDMTGTVSELSIAVPVKTADPGVSDSDALAPVTLEAGTQAIETEAPRTVAIGPFAVAQSAATLEGTAPVESPADSRVGAMVVVSATGKDDAILKPLDTAPDEDENGPVPAVTASCGCPDGSPNGGGMADLSPRESPLPPTQLLQQPQPSPDPLLQEPRVAMLSDVALCELTLTGDVKDPIGSLRDRASDRDVATAPPQISLTLGLHDLPCMDAPATQAVSQPDSIGAKAKGSPEMLAVLAAALMDIEDDHDRQGSMPADEALPEDVLLALLDEIEV